MAELPPTPKLVVINTPHGARFSVAAEHKDAFQGAMNELEAGGYLIDPKQSGGYNRRYIAGTDTPSNHAYGTAVDVNWNANPRGGAPGTLQADVARAVAKKYGLTWGGDWEGKTRDPMHFEIAQPATGALGVATANLPTPPIPPEGEPPPVAVAQAPAPAVAQALPLDPRLLPRFGGGAATLADAFAQAAKAGQQVI